MASVFSTNVLVWVLAMSRFFSVLVRLETGAPRRHTGNRGPLAQRRIPMVLEGDLQRQEAIRRRLISREDRAA